MKQKSSMTHNDKSYDGITSIEHIQTRFKKGVIKSNPEYVWLSWDVS